MGSFDEHQSDIAPLRHRACWQKSRPSAFAPDPCDPPASQRYLTRDVRQKYMPPAITHFESGRSANARQLMSKSFHILCFALASVSCVSANKPWDYRVKYDFHSFWVRGHDAFLSTQDVELLDQSVAATFPAKKLSFVEVASKRSVFVHLRESPTHWRKYHFIWKKDNWILDQKYLRHDVWY